MKDILLVVVLISSFAVAYIPVTWVGKYIKEKWKRNSSFYNKK